jgi:TolA-binding protein
MKKPLKLMLFGAILINASCVTTRAQMNEKNGVTEDAEAPVNTSEDGTNRSRVNVKTENLTPATDTAIPAKNSAAAPTKMTTDTTVATPSPPMTAGSPNKAAPSIPSSAPIVAAPIAGVSVGTIAANGGAYTDDELKAELARVSGQVEELQHNKQIDDQQHQDAEKKYQDRIAELEKQLKANEAPAGPVVPEGKSPFEAGKDAYFADRYEDAIAFFDQYLQGKDLKAADEATFLRAESNFKEKNYKKAIVDYSKFPEKYQKSKFHPKALLGIAQSFDEMGMKDDAKAFYSELADKFPKTAEGKLAKKKLKK